VPSPHAAPVGGVQVAPVTGRATVFRACRDHRQAARLHRRRAADGDVPAGRVLRRPRQPTRSSSGSPAGSSCATTCATPADRPPSTPTCPATRCATSSPTPSAYSTGSASPAHTWRASRQRLHRAARSAGPPVAGGLARPDRHPSVRAGTRRRRPARALPGDHGSLGNAPPVDWTARTSIPDAAVDSRVSPARLSSTPPRPALTPPASSRGRSSGGPDMALDPSSPSSPSIRSTAGAEARRERPTPAPAEHA
jgi:hypothetical protein